MNNETADIRGEYWIQNGSVDFADGDIGDRNHEGIAIDYVFSQYSDQIINLAEQLGIETQDSYEGYNGVDTEAISQLLDTIWDHLTIGNEDEEQDPSMNSQQAEAYLEENIDANKDAMQILRGGGDARLYVMVYDGWIAVRENNAELYGYDQEKQSSLANGLADILDQEGISETIAPENVELSIFDHKTRKSWYVTLEDLERPMARAQTTITTAKKDPYYKTNPKDSEENRYSNPAKSGMNRWNAAGQNAGIIGPGQQLWRGTSENKYPSFLEWLTNKNRS